MNDTKQQWFKEAKFGLFIHWGLYSILAGEYNGKKTTNIAEWIMNDLQIPAVEYRKLAKQFTADHFNAEAIVKKAKEDWGMKYVVFTAKHHDGFAMYHSKSNAYNSMEATPCQRDFLKELQLACEKYDMKLGVYYSQAQDWDDPDGYMKNYTNPDKEGKNEENIARRDNSAVNYRAYLERKCYPQLREILTGYGKISIIWFDTPMDTTIEESREMVALVKELQPECIISGRIGNELGEYMSTGDNFIPRLPYEGDWEVPATLNDTWGYNKDDHSWKSPDDILRLLIKINARGGNYLLNIGPDGTGKVPEESIHILDTVGGYVTRNAEAIYGGKRMPVYPYELNFGEMTCKPGHLYMHVFREVKKIDIPNIANQVKRAYLVESGEELDFHQTRNCQGDGIVIIHVPEQLQGRRYYCVGLEYEEELPVFEVLHN